MTGAQPGASSPARTKRWIAFRDAFLDSSRVCQAAQQQEGIPADLVACTAQSLGVSETVLLTLLGLEAATLDRSTSAGERLGSSAAKHLMTIGAIQASPQRGIQRETWHWARSPHSWPSIRRPIVTKYRACCTRSLAGAPHEICATQG